MSAPTAVVVIPCYNEAARLDRDEIMRLAQAPGMRLVLVDDGSADGTAVVLTSLAEALPERISWLGLTPNQGKAEAVRQGMLAAGEADLVGFLDADLATPVDEMLRLVQTFAKWPVEVILGSRVALAGRDIERHPRRHYLGRVFATVASSYVLGEVVYDTQCGAKLFHDTPLLRACLQERFRSRWSFDVELIGRLLIGTDVLSPITMADVREVPLQTWRDVEGSKIHPMAMVKSGLELFLIRSDLELRRDALAVPEDEARNPLIGALDRLTRPPVLSWVSWAQLALMGLVVAVYVVGRRDPLTHMGDPGTGDFLAFWTGAQMVADGLGASLYDFEVQRQVQWEVLGEQLDQFQGYLNPPLLAVALSPFVGWGYLSGFFIFDMVSAAVLFGGLLALTTELRHVATTNADKVTLAALAIGFHPVLRTAFGGQNTAITLGLLCGLYVLVCRGRWVWAGLCLGLLTYKPQFAVGLGVALLVARQPKVVFVGAAVGLAHYGVGALVSGPQWPLRMLEGMAFYSPLELASNASTHFSWIRATDFSLPQPMARWVGLGGAGLAVIAMVGAGLRTRAGAPGFGAFYALAVVTTLFASPHLQYYDAGLLVLPVVLLLESHVARHGSMSLGLRLAVTVLYLAYPTYIYADVLGVQPLALVLVTVWVGAVASVLRQGLVSTE